MSSKFKVYGSVPVSVTMTVEADSADEAITKAYAAFPGLTNYMGNGGWNQLVGVCNPAVSLEAISGAEVEFDSAEPAA